MNVLFVHNCPTEFVKIDHELLSQRFDVREVSCRPGLALIPTSVSLASAVAWSDVVVCWFASWHAVEPALFAQLFRRRFILIAGGYDTANLPEINYGHQRGGVTKVVSSWVIRHATELIVNSHYSAQEVKAHIPQVECPVRVLYHGVRDTFGGVSAKVPNLVITVGNVNQSNLLRKGIHEFCEAARFLPEVEFVVVGRHVDDSVERLRSRSGDNVRLVGYLNEQDLAALYRSASVYVQPSRHEAFGMSVAESMLAGCIPVVSNRGALPEVVGDCGIVLADCHATALASGIRKALQANMQQRMAGRNRVLDMFSMSQRGFGLAEVVSGGVGRNGQLRHRV
jgi:glycosyltransferase involved in cell wall biosynthesis